MNAQFHNGDSIAFLLYYVNKPFVSEEFKRTLIYLKMWQLS